MEPNDSFNPYQTQAVVDDAVESTDGTVSLATIEMLKKTRPWVLFVGVLGYVFAGLIVLGGVLMAFFLSRGQNVGFAVGAGSVYVAMGLLCLAPATYLVRYAKGIKRLEMSPSVVLLNETLAAQKSFWKFSGIMCGLIFCFYAVAILIALVFGGFAAGGAAAQQGL